MLSEVQVRKDDGEIDFVKNACILWGIQKMSMMHSSAQGWNGKSLTERFVELQNAAGSGTQKVVQFQEEGHTGWGLHVARAIQGNGALPHMPHHLFCVLFVHYAVRSESIRVKNKMEVMGLKKQTYWQLVSMAETFIAARLPGEVSGQVSGQNS